MTIYYSKNNKIYADRYDKLPTISGIVFDTPETFIVKNQSIYSNNGKLESSIQFGTDTYILDNITFKPIFKLYHKFFK